VRAAVEAAAPFTPEPPRPLERELPPAQAYPVDALGPLLGPAARAVQERVQAPAAVCAQSVLAVAALAVQGHADVLLPYGRRRPASCYFVTIAESGERKSSADAEALAPVRAVEERLHAERIGELASFQVARAAWDAERKRVLADKRLGRAERERELNLLGPEPQPPLAEMLTCPEPTIEGLARLFAAGRPSLGLFSDEGGQFIGGFAMSQDHRLKTAAALSSLWEGGALKPVRAVSGASYLPGRRLSLHLLVQPNVAAQLIGDPLLVGQGLLSRLLVVAPESAAGTRFWREPADLPALDRFRDRLAGILERPLPLRPGTVNELAPRTLDMTPEARGLWTSFADHIERQLGPGEALSAIKAFAAKAAEHAARLGAVLSLVEDLESGELGAAHLAAGIELVQHHITEWLRLSDAAWTRPEIARARRLLEWLQAWDEPYIGLVEIYQRGPNAIRDARAAREAVAILEEHGWLLRAEGGAVVKGTFRREAWRVVRV